MKTRYVLFASRFHSEPERYAFRSSKSKEEILTEIKDLNTKTFAKEHWSPFEYEGIVIFSVNEKYSFELLSLDELWESWHDNGIVFGRQLEVNKV